MGEQLDPRCFKERMGKQLDPQCFGKECMSSWTHDASEEKMLEQLDP